MIKIGEKCKLEIEAEIHCDQCNEIIHNHIDCPVCGKEFAPTEDYRDLNEDYLYNNSNTITCECGAVFELIEFADEGQWVYDEENIWKRIK